MPYIEDLSVEVPFQYLAIQQLKIQQEMGAHAYGQLELLLEPDEGTKVIEKLDANTIVTVKVENQVLFKGIPLKTKLRTRDQVNTIWIELVSCSFKMDVEQKKRSFQDSKQTYSDLFTAIAKEYQGGVEDYTGKGKSKDASLIQYLETDWAFLKRVASQLQAMIYPDPKFDKPKLYVGVHYGKVHSSDNINYTIEKDIRSFHMIKAVNSEWSEDCELSYQIQALDNFELGDKIQYDGVTLTIFEKRTELLESTVFHLYSLKMGTGIAVIPYFNEQLRGVSIVGKVLEIEKSRLKVHLEIDEKQDKAKAFWYSFETSYANSGDTGWYCMPQVGDSVSLYVEADDERNACVRKVIRTDGDDKKFKDVANKCFGTIHGNELVFTPTDITFSQVDKKMYLKLHQSKGVELVSSQDIVLNAEDIGVDCKAMELVSKSKILLATSAANIIVDKVIHLKNFKDSQPLI